LWLLRCANWNGDKTARQEKVWSQPPEDCQQSLRGADQSNVTIIQSKEYIIMEDLLADALSSINNLNASWAAKQEQRQ
jgi:hypothetical protein